MKAIRSTVSRAYQKWRESSGLPARCDNAHCVYNTAELRWNGSALPLILDHIEGNSHDNRPEMLRYLCPNCESQLSTRGGKNRGRVRDLSEDAFVLIERDGKRAYTSFASGGIFLSGSGEATFHVARKAK
jgi:hypothetical protein